MWSRLRQLTSDSLIYGLGGVAARFVGLFLVPIFTRVFQPDEYGILDIITTATVIVSGILMLGTDAAVGFYFFDTDDRNQRRLTVSTWLYFQVGLVGVVCLGLLPLAGPLSAALFRTIEYITLIRLALLTLPLSFLAGICMTILRLRFATGHYSILSVGTVSSNALLSVYLVVFRHIGIAGVLWANLLTNAVFSVIGLSLTIASYTLRFSMTHLLDLLKYGVPLVPAAIAGWTVSFASRYFLLYMMSLHEVGLFSIGNKVASIVLLLVSAFQTAWGPFALSLAKESDAKKTYAKVLTYYVVFTAVVALLLSTFSREILLVLTQPAYVAAYQVVGLLALGMIANGAYYIVAIGVNLTKKTAYISGTTAVAAAVNIAANFVLIPWLGILGAAAATLLGNLASTCLLYRVAQRFYPVPYETAKVAKASLLTIGFMAPGLLVQIDALVLSLFLKMSLLTGFVGLLYAWGVLEKAEVAKARALAVRAAQAVLTARIQ